MQSLAQFMHSIRKKLCVQNVTIPTQSVNEFLKFLKNKFILCNCRFYRVIFALRFKKRLSSYFHKFAVHTKYISHIHVHLLIGPQRMKQMH